MAKKIDVAIVFAGGKGTRNSEYTYNGAIPKILVSLGNETVLDRIVNCWKNVSKRIVIVVSNESWEKQILEYIAIKKYENIKIARYDKQDGTFNTVTNVVNSYVSSTEKHLGIFWSDIWLETHNAQFIVNDYFSGFKTLSKNNFDINQCHIVLDKENVHRYALDTIDNEVMIYPIPDQTGDICGLYIMNRELISEFTDFARLQNLYKSEKQYDIIDVINMFNIDSRNLFDTKQTFITTSYSDVFDVGDAKKLTEFTKNVDLDARFFNKLTFTPEHVIKESVDYHGLTVAINEINWYDYIYKDFNSDNFLPAIYETKFDNESSIIVMENLKTDGFTTLFEFINNNELSNSEYTKLINSVMNGLTKLHEFTDYPKPLLSPRILREEEYIDVTNKRYESIKNIVDSELVLTVFGHTTCSYDTAIKIIKDELVNNTKSEIVFGHGDANASNVMVRKSMQTGYDIKFIDPRGKFGSANYVTDSQYDLAKLIYGITGYCEFNTERNFKAQIDSYDLTYDCVDPIMNLSAHQRLLDLPNEVCLMVGLIWLKLPAYIINNPTKSIAAYNTGLAIINKYRKQ